jgi:hypothetical protein
MPNLGSIASKQGSYSDSAVLRRASSLDYKGSTTGSFVGGGSSSYVAAGARDSELAAATRDIDTNLLGDNQAGGLPMHGRYRLGFFAQYFTVGVIYGGLPATTYGFLLGYLNTRPRTSHMVRVMNPNPALCDEARKHSWEEPFHHGDHGGGHDDGHGGGHGDHAPASDGHGEQPKSHAYIDSSKRSQDGGYAMSLKVLGASF